MIFPTDVGVRSAKGGIETRFWFEADPGMLAAAARIGAVELKRCTAEQACLTHAPRLVVGGNGVSGQTFVDNAGFRQYVFETFKAQVLDMESAAVAMVAYANGVPFIAFRSLSDLAGGERRRQRAAHVLPAGVGQFGRRGATVPDAVDAAPVTRAGPATAVPAGRHSPVEALITLASHHPPGETCL